MEWRNGWGVMIKRSGKGLKRARERSGVRDDEARRAWKGGGKS